MQKLKFINTSVLSLSLRRTRSQIRQNARILQEKDRTHQIFLFFTIT